MVGRTSEISGCWRREGAGAVPIRLFGPRILPFDQEAASIYAKLFVRARAAGHAITFADGQIAAIAAAHGFIVATRDTVPFAAAGVPVIDPWEARRPGSG